MPMVCRPAVVFVFCPHFLRNISNTPIPGHIVQLIMCLTTDACLAADPGS